MKNFVEFPKEPEQTALLAAFHKKASISLPLKGNPKFLPLVHAGIVGVVETMEGSILYRLDMQETKQFTVIFRLPPIEGNVRVNKDARMKFSGLKRFLTKWISHSKTENVDKLAEQFKFFTPNPCVIAIPNFLKVELEKDLAEAEIQFNIISPDMKDIICPMCDNEIEVDKFAEVATCPECDAEFVI